MKNLYEKLSQENKAKLEKMGEKYPTIFRLMKRELEEATSYLDIRVETAFNLVTELKDTSSISILLLDDLFNKDHTSPTR
jgi:hypothetical protein